MCCWGELTYLYIYFLISFLETKSGGKKINKWKRFTFFFLVKNKVWPKISNFLRLLLD